MLAGCQMAIYAQMIVHLRRMMNAWVIIITVPADGLAPLVLVMTIFTISHDVIWTDICVSRTQHKWQNRTWLITIISISGLELLGASISAPCDQFLIGLWRTPVTFCYVYILLINSTCYKWKGQDNINGTWNYKDQLTKLLEISIQKTTKYFW